VNKPEEKKMIMHETLLPATLVREEVLNDYRLGWESRHASLLGRKEVFMGKAKFGIFGDGKELAQLAMAKVFRKGDFRSGYYRDQTFMMAIGELTLEQYFAQLYAHPNVQAEPATGGRMMSSHFATRMLDDQGKWKNLMQSRNSSADVSPTAAQMPRLVGLGYASKLYRQNPDLHGMKQFSNRGNEIAFGTIGNASSAEGMFFESVNAAGVLQIPVLISVYDDGYGISVPNEYQLTKGNISSILAGFQRTEDEKGFEIFKVRGWDYLELIRTYQEAEEVCRYEHVPVLVHVEEMTQPQGHSTSGSHERYKSRERLDWEEAYDCLKKMREWMLETDLATPPELDTIEKDALERAKQARSNAWNAYMNDIQQAQLKAMSLLLEAAATSKCHETLIALHQELSKISHPMFQDAVRTVKRGLRVLSTAGEHTAKVPLMKWLEENMQKNRDSYSSHLYSESDEAALLVKEVKPVYSQASPMVDARQVMQACFDAMFARDPRVFALGEDVGRIGDVNQGFAGLQEKYGELRITDTGIRECTIIGQGIGAALRGLRPIAEIQYLDYFLYALQILSDDLACLQYRTKGGQKAPLIIRTRGHRLEGTWHAGSPMGTIIHALRGIHVLVPRNMTQAAGLYNTLLASDEPGLVIECLNGYRLKERLPDNIGEIKTPLGVPEVLRQGEDTTLVTYGSMCRIVMEAAQQLAEYGIDCEVIDVQSLLPFDIHHSIVKSLQKTGLVLFTDEDVPGGATAYMMQQVLEVQQAYQWLDGAPRTLTANAHRPAYASDGDYFSKPSTEDVFDAVYTMLQEHHPGKFPALY
jgi:2-oxoisovalerate dehydrogenase E1 component